MSHLLLTVTLAALIPASLAPMFWTELDRADDRGQAVERAAQIAQESSWRPDAASRYAQGLAQFTPPTRDWFWPRPQVRCDPADAYDPPCNFRAQIGYMRWIQSRFPGMADYRELLAISLAGYNAGPGWLIRERRACRAVSGCDPDRWFGHVETQCERAAWACAESRHYVRRILGELYARYRPLIDNGDSMRTKSENLTGSN